MATYLLTDEIKDSIRDFAKKEKNELDGLAYDIPGIKKQPFLISNKQFPNQEDLYIENINNCAMIIGSSKEDGYRITKEQWNQVVNTDLEDTDRTDYIITRLFDIIEEKARKTVCKKFYGQLKAIQKARKYRPFILNSLDEMYESPKWGWVAELILLDERNYNEDLNKENDNETKVTVGQKDTIGNRQRWSIRRDNNNKAAKSVQDKIFFKVIEDKIETEADIIYEKWYEKNVSESSLFEDTSIIPEKKDYKYSSKYNYWFRNIAFDLLEDQIAFLLYYLDVYYGYATSMLEPSELVKLMIAEWTRIIKNETEHTQGAYVENAVVWFNLREFWNRINREKFAKNFITKSNFLNEDWQNRIDRVSESVLKTYIQKSTCKYIVILTANPVEHFWCSKLLYELLPGDSTITRCILTSGKSQNVYEYIDVKGSNYRILHIAPNATGSFTLKGSFQSVNDALRIFEEKRINIEYMFSLGIAYGLYPNDQLLGDVLVSSRIYSYETIKRKNNELRIVEDFVYKPGKKKFRDSCAKIIKTSSPTDTRVEKNEYLISKEPTLFDKSIFHAWYSPILSGSQVLSDAYEKKKIIHLFETSFKNDGNSKLDMAIGGEMEATGIWYALWTNGSQAGDIPFTVIKAFCDWGAMKNSWALITEPDDKIFGDMDREQMNDNIKDGIQAMGVCNAFLTMLYLLKYLEVFDLYDSDMLNNYNSKIEGLFK